MNKFLIFLLGAAVALAAQEKIYASFDVAAVKDAQLALKAVGIVKSVNVEIGAVVKRGDVLLELENESEKLAVQLAQNDLENANAAKDHTKSVLDKFKLVQSVSSKQAFEDAQFEFRRAQIAQKKAQIALNLAQKRLEDTRLSAPFDGAISGKSIEAGEGVGGVAQKLMSMFSYPEVKLKLSFDEKFRSHVKIGSEFVYKLDGESEERRGKISLIYPTIDTKNSKIYAEVRVIGLTPGLFGEGYIVSDVRGSDTNGDEAVAPEPKNSDANLTDANKTSKNGLKFDGAGGLKKNEFVAIGVKFDSETAMRFANISSLPEIAVNFISVAGEFKKASGAAFGLNLARERARANLNQQAKFDATQILLVARNGAFFGRQNGRKNLVPSLANGANGGRLVATNIKFGDATPNLGDCKSAANSFVIYAAKTRNLGSNLNLFDDAALVASISPNLTANQAALAKLNLVNLKLKLPNLKSQTVSNLTAEQNMVIELKFASLLGDKVALNLVGSENLIAINLTPNLRQNKNSVAEQNVPKILNLIKNQVARSASNLLQNPNLTAKKTESKNV